MEFIGNQIKIEPPKKPKKLTGTRLASVLGLDVWNTEFKTWCDITKTYVEPFEDNKYTLAGKAIEPKVIQYLKDVYLLEVITPEDIYGENFFQKTWGNFFPESPPFGGMWDSLLSENGQPIGIIEIKTSSRPQDWEYDIPENYAIQGALYAWLKKLERVTFVCSFLDEQDYINPELFIPSANNTIIREFNLYERYPDFDEKMSYAHEWYKRHVENGISPHFDEKKDADILKILRTNFIDSSEELQSVLSELNNLEVKIKEHTSSIKDDVKRQKELRELIKTYAIDKFGKDDETVVIESDKFNWTIKKSVRESVNKDLLKEDGIFDKYVTISESYSISPKEVK